MYYLDDETQTAFDKGWAKAIEEKGIEWRHHWRNYEFDPFAAGYIEACCAQDENGDLWDEDEV